MKNHKAAIFIAMLFLSPLILYPQVDTAWVRRYNGPENLLDEAHSIAVDPTGNIYVTGYSGRLISTTNNYTTVKYNSSGDTLWVRSYDGSGNGWDEAYDIAVDDSGYGYVTGRSYSTLTDDDYATIKYSPSGIEQWVRTYDGQANSGDDDDFARAIAVDDLRNVYVTGQSAGPGTNLDLATIKYNPSGVGLWVKRYSGPGKYSDDGACAIAVDGAGNVYVTGYCRDSVTSYDYVTIKYDSFGIEQWVRKYDGPANYEDRATAIAVDGSGNVYVTGGSAGSGNHSDYATIKYNSSGDTLWVRRYDGPDNNWDYASAIAIDGSGNVYVAGESYSSGTDFDYVTIKYSTTGNIQWMRSYNGPGNANDVPAAMAVDGSSNVYVTGGSIKGSSMDYATIKYNSAGVEQWVIRYDGPVSLGDWASAIAIDGSGNVYVTGCSYGSGTNMDFATLKYVQVSRISENEREPQKLNLVIKPNPARGSAVVSYHLPVKCSVSLRIYNASGRLINAVTTDKGFFTIRGLPAGLYFLKTEAFGHKQEGKLIILK